MRDDMSCPLCGAINDFASSYLGSLCGCEHHRCRWCDAQFFVDEVEDGFVGDCERVIEFVKLLPEPAFVGVVSKYTYKGGSK